MDPPSSTSLFHEDPPMVDDAFAESMGFVTTYLRAVESARQDRLINDPYAELLTRKHQHKIEKFMSGMANEIHSRPEDFIAFRTRYLDEALAQRDPRILQVVILGAGLDVRAFRLECLYDCRVLEVDQSSEMFDHKMEVMIDLDAPLAAATVEFIVSNLKKGLEASLVAREFDPSSQGLIPELWADIPGKFVADAEEWGKRAMKHGEDDPLHGMLSEIGWTVEIQASLDSAGDRFGRRWMPMLSPKTRQEVPFAFVVAKKPILKE